MFPKCSHFQQATTKEIKETNQNRATEMSSVFIFWKYSLVCLCSPFFSNLSCSFLLFSVTFLFKKGESKGEYLVFKCLNNWFFWKMKNIFIIKTKSEFSLIFFIRQYRAWITSSQIVMANCCHLFFLPWDSNCILERKNCWELSVSLTEFCYFHCFAKDKRGLKRLGSQHPEGKISLAMNGSLKKLSSLTKLSALTKQDTGRLLFPLNTKLTACKLVQLFVFTGL